MKTLYVKKSAKKILNLSQFPNAGPNPSITGMKEKFWGKDAQCIKSGSYVYKVDKKTYHKAKHLNLCYKRR